ncbi:hypothetical protein AAHB56_11215 [Bacillus thuringiensis]|uniref:hypothetical protein n=1 Tax=Bacillus basilensis TaxID=3243721 RepID=UPI001E3D9E7B|nr:hypothetical protein [Bacillus sp. (in: firmicutes)]
MIECITGTIEAINVTDYYGNDRPYIDLYDESTNQVLYDLTSKFHGKKVKITIQENED